MLSPTDGEVHISGKRVAFNKSDHLCELRRSHIGFVFQHAQLLPFLSMEDNLKVVGMNSGLSSKEVNKRVDDLMNRLGIERLRRKKPGEASGGQRQRVAIARAMLHRPSIILADEPTAALDWHNGYAVMQMLREQTRQENTLLVTVTHDTRLIEFFDRVFHLDSGRLTEQ
jgi:putative ABC transport system ATP-binding protein